MPALGFFRSEFQLRSVKELRWYNEKVMQLTKNIKTNETIALFFFEILKDMSTTGKSINNRFCKSEPSIHITLH